MHDTDLNSNVRNWPRCEKFEIFRASEFLSAPEKIRNTVGVYMILLQGADKMLERVGLPQTDLLTPWSLINHQHVYTGLSVAISSRALLHLRGTVQDSAVRETLLALQFGHEILWDGRDVDLDVWERRLNRWLAANALVAFRVCDDARKAEKDLIGRLPSPFNTDKNRNSPHVPFLAEKRHQFRQHLEATGKVRHRDVKSPSKWLLDATANHLAGLQSRQST
ncbi:MAG TPA: hypothetical protein VGT78_05395 [Rhizomicrobium sp.]|nr:hypothetical protein [Rhizomicrobium sp.]